MPTEFDAETYTTPSLALLSSLNAKSLIETISDVIALPLSSVHAIEVGAGVGSVTVHLPFRSIYALEPSPMALELGAAVSHLPHVSFGQLELVPGSGEAFDAFLPVPSPTASHLERALPPPRTRFDLAYSTLVLHHAASIPGFFKGVYEVLEPGAYFFILEFRTGHFEDLSIRLHLEEDAENVPVDIPPADGEKDKILVGKEFWRTRSAEQVLHLFNKFGFTQTGWSKTKSIPAWSYDGVVEGERGVPTLVAWGRKP